VFRDSAYRSAAAEEKLAARGLRSRICVRGMRSHPLSKAQAAANRAKSRIRARIEHVFGAQV
jgi:IS5 family transposase